MLAVLLCGAQAAGQNDPRGTGGDPAPSVPVPEARARSAVVELWPELRGPVEDGLKFLRSRQGESGAVGSSYPVAVTALAGLAVLGAGHQPRERELGPMLEKCFLYLAGAARPHGNGVFISEEGDGSSRMHGHCYALLFLCELYGSLPGREEEISSLIRRGITVLERAQSNRGGWYYAPDNVDGWDEASVTVCALQALRAARNVGFAVDSKRVDYAVSYVRRCQSPRTASFVYSLTPEVAGHDRSTYALTVAALSTLNAAGVYRSEELKKGLDFVRRSLAAARSPWSAAEEDHDFYGNLYAAQALYQEGGDLWTSWYPRVRDHLIKKQREGGSWECQPYGDEYATAMSLLILEVPLGYLPIFQR